MKREAQGPVDVRRQGVRRLGDRRSVRDGPREGDPPGGQQPGTRHHQDAVSCFAQIQWATDLVNEFPAVETWVVNNDGRPLAVVAWDTRLERQVRDSGLLIRRFAHSINRDVIPHVWSERPAHPVAVHVDHAAGA